MPLTIKTKIIIRQQMSSTDLIVWGNNHQSLLSSYSDKFITRPELITLRYPITQLCSSEQHISFLTAHGEVYSYGGNLDGRLGAGLKSGAHVRNEEAVRVEVPGRAISIVGGFSHVCVGLESGEVFAWGFGEYGALGTGELKSSNKPVMVKLPHFFPKQISCGAMHSAFLTKQGSLYMCGSNQYGELGIVGHDKIPLPSHLSFAFPIKDVACGVFYTLILTKAGQVYSFGNNKYGQLGIGNRTTQAKPMLVEGLEEIVTISAGYHSGAVDKFGNLYIWGSGSFGEYLKPRKYVMQVPIRDVSIRGFFGVALGESAKTGTQLFCWGNNTYGELGNGSVQAAKQPIEIEELRGIKLKKLCLGINFCIALLSNEEQQKYQHIPTFGDLQKVLKPSNRESSSLTKQRASSPSFPKNQKMLLMNLSEDYQILVEKYEYIEKKLQLVQKEESSKHQEQIAKLSSQLFETINQLELTQKFCEQVSAAKKQIEILYEKDMKKHEEAVERLAFRNEQLLEECHHLKQIKEKLQTLNKRNQHQVEEKTCLQIKKLKQTLKRLSESNSNLNQKIIEHSTQLEYEKQLNQKYNESILELKESFNSSQEQLKQSKDMIQELNKKIEEQSEEITRNQRYRKENNKKNIQIQELNEEVVKKQSQCKVMLEESKKIVKKHEEEINRLLQQNQYLQEEREKYQSTTKQLKKSLEEEKEKVQKKQEQMIMKKSEMEIFKQQKVADDKKILFFTNESQNEGKQKLILIGKISQLKREIHHIILEKGEIENQLSIALQSEGKIRSNFSEAEKLRQDLQIQLKRTLEKCENLASENTTYKEEISLLHSVQNEQKNINDELSKANKEFAQNQSLFNIKITELEYKITQLEQNKAYTPRYEALLRRNQQLDERNRQLAEMVNRAIRFQASTMENQILKDVKINTKKLISSVGEEQKIGTKKTRVKTLDIEVKSQEQNYDTPKLPQDPFKKLVVQRVSMRQEKVSESAKKLAHILEVQETRNKRSKRISKRVATQSYEPVFDQVESLAKEKKEFMKKIHSFAEKYKIL